MKYTTDGGNIWSSQSNVSNADILSIEMRNSSLGWLFDSDGDLYKYSSLAGIVNIKTTESIYVYPNPIEDFIYILNSDVNWSRAVLMDATGKVIYTTTMQKTNADHFIDISDFQLAPGIYLLRLENSHLTGLQKIIKK